MTQKQAKQMVALDSARHKTQGWQRPTHYRVASADTGAPLVLPELLAASASYPLAFALRPDGSYQLLAVLGLHAGNNLFVDAQGRWLAGYVPSHYRAYPFALRTVQMGDAPKTVLCFDPASEFYREAPNASLGEQRFFDDQGQLQPLMAQLLQFLTTTAQAAQQTDVAVVAVAQAQLLEPWVLGVENPDPQRPLMRGLYRVNEKALQALSGEQLKALSDCGALALAFAQLFSVAKLGALRQLCALRMSQATPLAAPAPATPLAPAVPAAPTALSAEQLSEVLKFDWLK